MESKFPLVDTKILHAIFSKLLIPYDNRTFESGDEFINYMKSYNYLDEQHMPKTRQVFRKGDNEITIDDVEHVGVIIELECHEDDPMTLVKTILKDDEWERSLEGTSYAWLTNVKGITGHIENIQRFDTVPDWNVWPHEKTMYEGLNK